MTLSIDNESVEVDRCGNQRKGDSFEYSARLIRLADPKSVPTL
jgi:hypothetical protein